VDEPKSRRPRIATVLSLIVVGLLVGGVVFIVRAARQYVADQTIGRPITETNPELLKQMIEETRRDREAFEREQRDAAKRK
jgi:uncharacterized membrane protein